MNSISKSELKRRDNAAYAGWLYYVAGKTQDDIAKTIGVSRQSAQRLVALAVNLGLVKVRLEHPITRCMELSLRLQEKYKLDYCEIVPSHPSDPSSTVGLAQAGARQLEYHLKLDRKSIIALGTGRVLRACIKELPPMECYHNKIVSLLGNMASDGSASVYGVARLMSDKINAKHYPMPMPVIFSSAEEVLSIHNQFHIKNTITLAKQANAIFIGIGNLGENSPLFIDGFISKQEIQELEEQGAVGEMLSWIYDKHGNLFETGINSRVASVPLEINPTKPVYAIASGKNKVVAIRGALKSKRINGLITNEYTAESLLC